MDRSNIRELLNQGERYLVENGVLEVRVPLVGAARSLNVAVAFGIAITPTQNWHQ